MELCKRWKIRNKGSKFLNLSGWKNVGILIEREVKEKAGHGGVHLGIFLSFQQYVQ
jgi:hypothetical protein